MDYMKKLHSAVKDIRRITDFKPKVALVLGSGLGGFADNLKIEETIPYNQIKSLPQSTVEGHKGQFVFANIEGVPTVIMMGRVHFYEGYPMADAVMPIRLMGLLGAEVLLLTNAAGGVNKSYAPGDFMLINDHISAFIPSPLAGANLDELGVRFPDMSVVYDKELRDIVTSVAKKGKIKIHNGVYLQMSGPQYETPTEIKMIAGLGADAVGMSTVCEAIAARHMGLRVAGISCITNMAAGISKELLSHEDVGATAQQASVAFEKLVYQSIVKIGGVL